MPQVFFPVTFIYKLVHALNKTVDLRKIRELEFKRDAQLFKLNKGESNNLAHLATNWYGS